MMTTFQPAVRRLPVPFIGTHGVPAAGLLVALLLAGCAGNTNRAPVEDRKPQPRVATPATPATPSTATGPAARPGDPAKPPPPGIENAGKPGYYSVKPGDALIRIALEHGQPWRDIARWNNLENPNLIEVGQVLRVVPPGVEPPPAAASAAPAAPNPASEAAPTVATTRPVAQAGRVESRPLDSRTPAPAASPAATPAPTATPAPSTTASATAPAAAPAAPRGDDDVNWAWPASGPVAAAFEEGRYKGVAITGRAGEPVLAAADGRVVYAGSGLRGYGNLVIIKHNNTYLTAYAHNQLLLVKDEQAVRRGQKIAEMGNSDAERVQLHFEIRRLGVPIDPQKLLPPR